MLGIIAAQQKVITRIDGMFIFHHLKKNRRDYLAVKKRKEYILFGVSVNFKRILLKLFH